MKAKTKLLQDFKEAWYKVQNELAANLVDDYTITQKIDELEQLTRLHCNRTLLQNGLICFDDIFVVLNEPEEFDPVTSNIEGIFIFKYKPNIWLTANLSIHIDRPSRLVQIESLLELKEKQEDAWLTIYDQYLDTNSLTFQQVKEIIHGCLL